MQIKIIISGLISGFVLGMPAVKAILPLLRRLKAGQSIREDGPTWHEGKSGTPTMGGIAIIISLIASSVIVSAVFGCLKLNLLFMIVVTLLYALIGFTDDYIKVVKKRNLGLTGVQKIALQLLFSVALAAYAYFKEGGLMYIPFLKQYVDFGLFYIPFAVFVMVAMTNAVNLTDGLDGLAAGVSSIVALFFAVVFAYFEISENTAFASALCGALLGFLVFNHYPAKLFMGDTGSLALGAALGALAITGRMEFLLPIAGGIYVAEAMSVIIQVAVFKTQNGRRFFRMAPLHHHYELGGLKETQIVCRFCLVTLVLCLICVLGVIRY